MPTVKKLIRNLKSPVFTRRLNAVWELDNIAPDAAEAIPALIELLACDTNDPASGYSLADEAAGTLSRIGSEAVPALILGTTNQDVRIRRGSIAALDH